jgi:hypothetical protein
MDCRTSLVSESPAAASSRHSARSGSLKHRACQLSPSRKSAAAAKRGLGVFPSQSARTGPQQGSIGRFTDWPELMVLRAAAGQQSRAGEAIQGWLVRSRNNCKSEMESKP